MPHAFFGLTMLGILGLCFLGLLPPDQFAETSKWVTIVYAASTSMVTIVRHIWPAPAQFDNLAVEPFRDPKPEWVEPDGVVGVGLRGFGSLRDDVFSDSIGDGVPLNYTSMVRDRNAPPVTTDGVDGSPVLVPSEGAQPDIDYNDAGLPLDFGQVRARAGVFGPVRIPPDITAQRGTGYRPPVNRGLAERLAAQAAASNEPNPNTVILGDARDNAIDTKSPG